MSLLGIVLVHVSPGDSQEFFYVGDLGRNEGLLLVPIVYTGVKTEETKRQFLHGMRCPSKAVWHERHFSFQRRMIRTERGTTVDRVLYIFFSSKAAAIFCRQTWCSRLRCCLSSKWYAFSSGILDLNEQLFV